MRCSVHHAPPHLAPINVRQLLTIEMENPSKFFKVNLLDLNIFKKCSITCNKGKFSKILERSKPKYFIVKASIDTLKSAWVDEIDGNFEYFKSKPRLQF